MGSLIMPAEWLLFEPHGLFLMLGLAASSDGCSGDVQQGCTQGGHGGTQYVLSIGWARAGIRQARAGIRQGQGGYKTGPV